MSSAMPSIIKSVKTDTVTNSLSTTYTNVRIYTMIEGLSSDIDAFNNAIQGKGIEITFSIPALEIGSSTSTSSFSIAHFDIKGVYSPDPVSLANGYWIVMVTGSAFSGSAAPRSREQPPTLYPPPPQATQTTRSAYSLTPKAAASYSPRPVSSMATASKNRQYP